MGNSKFHISKEAKDIIDSLKVILEIEENPPIVKLALAKGISLLKGPQEISKYPTEGQWLVPENIIKDDEFLLFKHLLINEYKQIFSNSEIHKYFAYMIEMGSRELKRIDEEKSSIEDFRTAIFS